MADNFGSVLLNALAGGVDSYQQNKESNRQNQNQTAFKLLDLKMKMDEQHRAQQQFLTQQALAQQAQQANQVAMQDAQVQLQTNQAKLKDLLELQSMTPDQRAAKAAEYKAQEEAKLLAVRNAASIELAKAYQSMGLNKQFNTPSNGSGGGQVLFTPDDLAKMADRKRSILQSTYQGQIDNALSGAPEDQARATYQPKIDEVLTPTWMQANLANPTDSLGVPPAMLSSAATTAPTQTQQQPAMTRAILEDAVKNNKLKKTDPQYIKWDKYFKARNQ